MSTDNLKGCDELIKLLFDSYTAINDLKSISEKYNKIQYDFIIIDKDPYHEDLNIYIKNDAIEDQALLAKLLWKHKPYEDINAYFKLEHGIIIDGKIYSLIYFYYPEDTSSVFANSIYSYLTLALNEYIKLIHNVE